MKNKLVIVVDMINGFCKEGALHDKKIMDIVPHIQALLDHTLMEDRMFVVDTHHQNAKEFQSFPIHCIAGSSEADIIDELKPYVNEQMIIRKNSTNATWCMNIQELMKTYENFVVVGCCSDICVMQLALALQTYINEYNDEKQVIVYQDACATYDIPSPENIIEPNDILTNCAYHPANLYHQMAMNMMQMAGIKVI